MCTAATRPSTTCTTSPGSASPRRSWPRSARTSSSIRTPTASAPANSSAAASSTSAAPAPPRRSPPRPCGHDIVYTAVSAPRPEHGALLVPEDSPVRTVTDLKGATVHLAIGSWQTHLVAKALDDAGLSYADDITAVRSTDDSEELLRTGAVAAWVAQGAQLAAARRTGGLRTLIRTGDVITDRSVFFARRDLAESRPEVVEALARALQRADDWAAAHPRRAAEIAAADLGGSADDWETALRTLPWRIEPVTDAFVAEQQEAADIFHRTGFIDRPVTVAHALAGAGANKAV